MGIRGWGKSNRLAGRVEPIDFSGEFSIGEVRYCKIGISLISRAMVSINSGNKRYPCSREGRDSAESGAIGELDKEIEDKGRISW